MIRSAYFEPNQTVEFLDNTDAIKPRMESKTGFLWVSLESATEDEVNLILRDTFNFHPLSIEDCLSLGYQVAKVDDFISYLFIIAHAIKPAEDIHELETLELNLFIGKNFLVTCTTEDNMSPIEKVWERVHKDFRLSNFGADFLCHTILDTLVDEYMPLIDKMDTEVELLEDSVLEKPEPATLEKLLMLKHSIMELRRVITPQREMINRLTRDEFELIDPQSRLYFRDIYDHLVRIQDLSDTIRDIVSGAMDIYLNSTSLRLNEVMKALTIVSTIFLPLSFIAGVFGMNFTHIPTATHPLGFYICVAVMILIGVSMLIYFRWRKWF
ncbi:MAG: magnesium and cobalt transport protein CorA [Chloroflexi bacterium HGW-Chloroflexi-5]|jgi:magnesium transporter|nr:MAG: magnesium and cobalt transport protein CorA [Chloroflexi bacterium HGW-Chloroflexi-5]